MKKIIINLLILFFVILSVSAYGVKRYSDSDFNKLSKDEQTKKCQEWNNIADKDEVAKDNISRFCSSSDDEVEFADDEDDY
jgi:uncharacterized protein YxeA